MINMEAVSRRMKGYRFFVSQRVNSLSGNIDFSGRMWDNRQVKTGNTRYKRGFHP